MKRIMNISMSILVIRLVLIGINIIMPRRYQNNRLFVFVLINFFYTINDFGTN